MQQATTRAISTPLLPIAEGVLVAPLVGELTRKWGAQSTETLLDGIPRQPGGAGSSARPGRRARTGAR
ncbi:hypothetical protein [Sorangium sp. So ce1151]|uniref:hypothetical protein n=1 Tax=Sorangium sp. So ce1151 TaxID=3133332 RepID=UPI003F5DDE7B